MQGYPSRRIHDHDRGVQRLLREWRAAAGGAVGRRPRGRQGRRAGDRQGFGDAANPLLVSVRSGAKFSMPGMMDTVLNLGLNQDTLQGLVALTGNERFGWDAYRRFIQMFGRIVMDVPGEQFDHALDAKKHARGVSRTRTSAPRTCASSSTSSARSSARPPAATSRRTRTSSSTSRSRPSSGRGSASARWTTAAARRSRMTSAPP